MQVIWHTIMGYIWAVLLVAGFVLGGLVWIGMAMLDTIRGLFRRLSGQPDVPQVPR